MKAVVYEDYGPPEVLQLREVEKPTPKDDEVLVEAHAASINYVDWQLLGGRSLLLRLMGNGLLRPKHGILGDDVAGRIEAVGRSVEGFRPGDEVFGISNFDAFAEFACVREDRLALKPANITFEEAASVPEAGVTALLGLRDRGKIQSGQRVLINGASGGLGTFAVQIAKSYGAEVTGVCSTGKLDFVRSIGADHVFDYTQGDITRAGKRYDLIFDAAAHRSILDYRRALSPEGMYVCAGGSGAPFFQAMLLGPLVSMTGRQKLGSLGMAQPTQPDFAALGKLLEAGKVVPAIDRCYPLGEVSEALRYYGEGHARGKIVIAVQQDQRN